MKFVFFVKVNQLPFTIVIAVKLIIRNYVPIQIHRLVRGFFWGVELSLFISWWLFSLPSNLAPLTIRRSFFCTHKLLCSIDFEQDC